MQLFGQIEFTRHGDFPYRDPATALFIEAEFVDVAHLFLLAGPLPCLPPLLPSRRRSPPSQRTPLVNLPAAPDQTATHRPSEHRNGHSSNPPQEQRRGGTLHEQS